MKVKCSRHHNDSHEQKVKKDREDDERWELRKKEKDPKTVVFISRGRQSDNIQSWESQTEW